ncbi:MAG: DUF4926 domain-containing protein [Ignavibacteriae bacterium]|nr:MAG: DUF4926 domain-containing protein [Ignavibacteriota bacterium]
MNRKLKILDVVAILIDIPEKRIVKGQVGTVVEDLDDNNFEIEFSDDEGKAIAMASVETKDLLLLHYNLEAA